MTANYPPNGNPNGQTPTPGQGPSGAGSQQTPYGAAGQAPQANTGPVAPQPYASAPQPAGQPYPSGGTGYNTGAVQMPTVGVQPAQGQQQGNAFSRFIKALFDLKFENFVTINFASVLYVLSIISAVGTWLMFILFAAISSAASSGISYYFGGGGGGGFATFWLLATIFLGWIPALVQIIISRVLLEFMVANIRTAQNTTQMRRALAD